MNFLTLVIQETRAVLSNSYVMLTAIGGIVLYSFLYPLPYAGQVPREQKIAVVNHDRNMVSLKLERMVDATPQVKIAARCATLGQAEDLFLDGEIGGILVIPKNFHKDILLGKSPTLAYAGDASYFLIYGAIAQGISQAQATLAGKVKIMNLIKDGTSPVLAKARYAPIHINAKPCFNPTMGYVHYVVPAVFVLLLHQTLIMAVGLMTSGEGNAAGGAEWISSLKKILIRTLVFSGIYTILTLYCFGWSFDFYNISRLARPLDLLIFLTPFLISASFVGYLTGSLIPRREYVIALVLVSSMPLIFTAGFIWPVESLPPAALWFSSLFPSTCAIQGFLALNQMGTDFQDILGLWHQLWILCLCWGLACLCAGRFCRR